METKMTMASQTRHSFVQKAVRDNGVDRSEGACMSVTKKKIKVRLGGTSGGHFGNSRQEGGAYKKARVDGAICCWGKM
jgi:hypothetical protein